MKKLLFLLTLLFAVQTLAVPVTVVDDLGNSVELQAPPKRIVSLAPHVTEILFSLGAGEKIVATVEHSDHPAAAKQIPRLGDAFSVSIEAVVDMAPDLIVAWSTGGNHRTVAHLKGLGYPIYMNEAPNLEAIGRTARQLGTLIGMEAKAQQLEADYNAELSALRAEMLSEEPLRVFFQISDEQLFTVNDSHFIGQSLAACGARNVFGDLALPVPIVSLESVLDADPDVILVSRPYEDFRTRWTDEWRRLGWQSRVRYIKASLITRPGLRILKGIKTMCKTMKDV